MSPEQSKGQTALVDGRSDVYSLGATLYELLALEPAMAGENSPAMLRAIEQQMPISLKTHRPDLPRDLVTVIEKAMAKNRDDRYLTAQEFADDLTRVLEGLPTHAKPPTWLERGTKWVQRNQRLVKTQAAIGLTTMLFFSLGLGFVWQTYSRQLAAERQSQRRLEDLLSQSGVYFSMFAELEGIPGTDGVRQRVYGHLLDDFRRFVSDVRDTGRTPTALDLALLHMGDLQRDMQDWSGAEKSLTEAEALLKQHVIREPKRVEHRQNLANCMTLLSMVKLHMGDPTAAEQLGWQAVNDLEQLAKQLPESQAVQHDWAKASNSLAMLWLQTGSDQKAQSLLAQTKARLEANVTRWPKEINLKKLLFAVCNNLAGASAEADAHKATELYETAVDIQLQVCQVDNGVRPSADLAVAYMNLGRALSREQKFTAAREAYAEACKLSDLVRQLDPNNNNFNRDHGLVLNNLAMAQQRTDETALAEQNFRQALSIQQNLCTRYPDRASLHHELGGTYNNLASLLERQGDVSEVDECYRLAIEHQTRAKDQSPEMTVYREFLDTHLWNYIQWLTKIQSFDRALVQIKARQELWTGDFPRQMVVARDIAEVALKLAADKRKQTAAVRYALAANEMLEIAQSANFGVQSYLKQDSFSSLAKLKSLTESARP